MHRIALKSLGWITGLLALVVVTAPGCPYPWKVVRVSSPGYTAYPPGEFRIRSPRPIETWAPYFGTYYWGRTRVWRGWQFFERYEVSGYPQLTMRDQSSRVEHLRVEESHKPVHKGGGWVVLYDDHGNRARVWMW